MSGNTDTIARASRAAALAAALLLFPGCATKHDLRDLQLDLRALAVRQDSLLATLARQSRVTQDTLRSQGDRLFDLRGDVSRQLRGIQDSVDRLVELLAQTQRSMAAMRDQLDALRAGRGGETAPGSGESILGGQQPAGGGAGGGGNAADATYQTALDLYHRDQIGTALTAFRDFVQQFGSHEAVPDARYYIGDILDQQGKTQDAMDAFNQIPQLHPTSPRVPDALFRMARLNLKLNKKDEARRLLERVINSYGDNPTAALARDELRNIK